MPPIQFWFTSSTLTLWVAILAALAALWVSINGDWQAHVREQTRITTEQAARDQRANTLRTVLDIAAQADAMAYREAKTEAEYQAWGIDAEAFYARAESALKPLITPAELAIVYSATGPSRYSIGAFNREHSQFRVFLNDMAEKLRNIALKYS